MYAMRTSNKKKWRLSIELLDLKSVITKFSMFFVCSNLVLVEQKNNEQWNATENGKKIRSTIQWMKSFSSFNVFFNARIKQQHLKKLFVLMSSQRIHRIHGIIHFFLLFNAIRVIFNRLNEMI